MTPAVALDRLADVVASAGLTESRSPLGVENQPATRIDRSFSILPGAITPEADRGQPTQAGYRVRQSFTITLGHKPAPSEGQRAPQQSLLDLVAVWRALSRAATELRKGAVVYLGGASHEYVGGGAYILTRMPVDLVYNLDLRETVL